jgi:hypothetical protein
MLTPDVLCAVGSYRRWPVVPISDDMSVVIFARAALRVLGVLVGHLGMAKPERVRPQLHSQISCDDLDGTPDHSLQESSAGQQLFDTANLGAAACWTCFAYSFEGTQGERPGPSPGAVTEPGRS